MIREKLQLPHHYYTKKNYPVADAEENVQAAPSSDYLAYWHLLEKPFENTTNPDYFYESYDHIEALERLFYLVEEGNMNFGMLTGEIGCGKTITRSVFKKRLSPLVYEVIDLENSNIPFNYIMLECIRRMSSEAEGSQPPDDNLYYLLKEFKKLLKNTVAQRRRQLIIILDEAQQLAHESIIELKNLTNITFDNQSPITIIMIGQPELRSVIKNLPQIDQRISLRYHLNPLSEKDTAGYLKHRLRVAGHPDGEVFTPEAVQFLCQATGGIPREINRVCKLSLDRAYSLGSDPIGREIVNSIVMDLHKQDGKLHG